MIGRFRDPGYVRGGGNQAITADWANRVRDSIVTLFKYLPDEPKKATEWTPKHQWEATANGDDTVSVADGVLLYPAGAGDIVYSPIYNEGSDVTITAAGHIYYKLTLGTAVVLDEATGAAVDAYTATGSTGVLEFQAGALLTGSAGNVIGSTYAYFPICEVTFTDSIAKVVKQYAQGHLTFSMQTVQDG